MSDRNASESTLTPPAGHLLVGTSDQSPDDLQTPIGPSAAALPFPTFTSFPIVGIGASAGGLKAVIGLLEALPVDIGMSFVFVSHLDPNHDSQLPTLLSRASRLPIEAAADQCRIQPNRVYVITPNTAIAIANATLRITARDQNPGLPATIDGFFTSLANDQPSNAIGIVLSGTGTDGTAGLKAIKYAAGITFAQDHTAEHSSMPLSATLDGNVDFVLDPAGIAQELVRIARSGFPIRLAAMPGETGQAHLPMPLADAEAYASILAELRTAMQVDFSEYRSTTILRRIVRRMAQSAIPTLSEYAHHLSTTPSEIEALSRDVLINVTSFYRDHAPFQTLAKTILPALSAHRAPGDPLRVWIVGCSTGQEVYSIAIELFELMADSEARSQLQIFATDISDWALTKARQGWYPDSIEKEVGAERLARYFRRDKSGYRITKIIRECCVFARHNIASDMPFSRMDLISCRNILIYFAPGLQQRILPLLHFSLKPGGYLWLGSAESLGLAAPLFETVDEQGRLFRAKACSDRFQQPFASPASAPEVTMSLPADPLFATATDVKRSADQIILRRFAPASALITASMEVVQLRGVTGPFLELPPGEPSFNLSALLAFGVAHALREALAEAQDKSAPVRRAHLPNRRRDSSILIGLEVIPIRVPRSSDFHYLVIFTHEADEASAATQVPAPGLPMAAPEAADPPGRDHAQLQHELATASDYIHVLAEEISDLRYQLKIAQDEAASNSEEYRSTNEELQTAKEEVDSTNEELVTINDELRGANEHLVTLSAALQTSADLTAAIVETICIPVLVLNARLTIIRANRSLLDTFRLTDHEVSGQPIYELGEGQWNIPELRRLLEDILPNHSEFDRFEVTHTFPGIGRRTMLLNGRRLQERGDRSGHIVLVFMDITEQLQSSQQLRALTEDLKRSNDELEHFAAVASHDLQEPLRMMSAYLSLLQRKYFPIFDGQAHQYMDYVISGAQRMIGMVTGILDYSRLTHESGAMTMVDSEFVLRSVLENLKSSIDEAHALIERQVLPTIRAHPGQLLQLLQNLVSNALKYRSLERIPLIRIAAAEGTAEWVFSISDNGIGMEPSSLERIFELFHRLQVLQASGTGIGLATCKRIVQHHGGRIWAESTLGTGSTFCFSLPK